MVGSLITELDALRRRGHHAHWNYIVSSAIAWARNCCVDAAIKNEYDWLYFWDADISFLENEKGEYVPFMEKLIELAEEKKAGAVGIPYSFKGWPTEYGVRDIQGRRAVKDVAAGHELNPQAEGNKLREVFEMPAEPFEAAQVATGAMLVRVETLKKMPPPWFSFVDGYENGEVTMWPEDYKFCDEIRKYSTIWVDPQFKTMHWGSFAFM